MLPASPLGKASLRLSLTIGGRLLGTYEGPGPLYLYIGPGGPGDRAGPVSVAQMGRARNVSGGSGNVEIVETKSNILEVTLRLVKK